MRKVYEFMYERQVGDRVGTWTIENRLKEIEQLFPLIEDAEWAKELPVQYNNEFVENTIKHHDISRQTIEEWFNDPEYQSYRDLVFMAKLLREDIQSPLRDMIADMFNFNHHKLRIRYQNQKPGKMIPIHLDGYKHHYYDLPPEEEYRVGRYIIFLEDQKLGQAWQLNNEWITWKKGDVLTWSHCITPHGTANFGYEERPILVVTGFKN